MNSFRVRRLLVIVGVVASFTLAVATVRAAAGWSAANAPLAIAPTSGESVAARIADAEARSADLEAELDTLRANGSGLAAALDAAGSQIAADADAAKALRARLATAQRRLATLEASIASARARVAAAPVGRSAPRPASPTIEHEGEGDG
jgi:peptidoglycan hydrolase CwlO-like protein